MRKKFDKKAIREMFESKNLEILNYPDFIYKDSNTPIPCECKFCGRIYNKNVSTVRFNFDKCKCQKSAPHGNTKHGALINYKCMTEYRSWTYMKRKCNNPSATGYRKCGALGIKVCERWRNSFKNFLEDMGRKPKGDGVKRYNLEEDFTPENCYWG